MAIWLLTCEMCKWASANKFKGNHVSILLSQLGQNICCCRFKSFFCHPVICKPLTTNVRILLRLIQTQKLEAGTLKPYCTASPPECWCCTDAMIVMTRSDAIGGQRKRWHFWRRARGTEGGNERAQEGTETDSEQRRSERGGREEEAWRWHPLCVPWSSANYLPFYIHTHFAHA